MAARAGREHDARQDCIPSVGCVPPCGRGGPQGDPWGRCAEAARAEHAIELGPILTSWPQRLAPEVAELRAECCFCDVEKLPAAGALEAGGARLAVYEVVDPALAIELGRRGARYVETFAFAEMSAALEALRRRAP